MLSAEYLAGLFDGEGWITFSYKSNGYIMCNVGISLANVNMITSLCDQFPESNLYEKEKSKLGNKQVYMFRLTGHKAQKFIDLIEPHVILKKEDLAFYKKWKCTCRNTTTKLTAVDLAAREAFIKEYKEFRNS